jgi:outer membrane biosynthesis protein TonB
MAFEQFLNGKQHPDRRSKRRTLTYAFSLSLHGAVLALLLVRSFWQVDELEPKGVPITMMTLRVPPPPPPPAPAEKRAAPQPKKVAEVVRPKRDKLVQPVMAKDEPPPTAKEEEAPAAEADGEPGGVEGGVSGGVASATAAPPPPPPAPKPVVDAPVMLPPSIGSGQRLTDLSDPRYRPTLPPSLNRSGMTVWGIYRICVSAAGKVKDVKVIKSADQLVDNSWCEIIHRWEYRPYSIDGRAVPFCHAARIEVRSQL